MERLSDLEKSVINAAVDSAHLWDLKAFCLRLQSLGIKSLCDVQHLRGFLKNRPLLFSLHGNDFHTNYPQEIGGSLQENRENPQEVAEEKFECVKTILRNDIHTVVNSRRILYYDNSSVLMFKISRIYRLYPICTDMWPSVRALRKDLAQNREFTVYRDTVHLKALLKQNISPDQMARMVVNVLLKSNQPSKIADILRRLPGDAKNQLKSSEGLISFLQFYPSVFQTIEDVVVISTLPCPITFKTKNVQIKATAKEGEEILKSQVIKLMKSAHQTPQNSKVFCLANMNLDSSFYSLNWIYEKLPGKSDFDLSYLKQCLTAHSDDFAVQEDYVKLVSPGVQNYCEKQIAVEVLQYQQYNSTSKAIFNCLSSEARSRIKNPNGLKHFRSLHLEFLSPALNQVGENESDVCLEVGNPPDLLKTNSTKLESSNVLPKTSQESDDVVKRFEQDFKEFAPIDECDEVAVLDLDTLGLNESLKQERKVVSEENDPTTQIKSLLKSVVQNRENSARDHYTKGDGKSGLQIFFKAQWVFEQSSAPSFDFFRKQIESDNAFYALDDFSLLQLKEKLELEPWPDQLARMVVDELLKAKHELGLVQDILLKLSPAGQQAFGNPNRLLGFLELYPGLFYVCGSQVRLVPSGQIVSAVPQAESREKYKPVSTAVQVAECIEHAQITSGHSTVFAGTIEKPLVHLSKVLRRLQKKNIMYLISQITNFVEDHPTMLITQGEFVGLKSLFAATPCEKTVALEILRILYHSPDSSVTKVINGLPQSCKTRIPRGKALKHFCKMQNQFLSFDQDSETKAMPEKSKTHQVDESTRDQLHGMKKKLDELCKVTQELQKEMSAILEQFGMHE